MERCKVGIGKERKGEDWRGKVKRKERGGKKPDGDEDERQGRGQRKLNDL